MNNMMLGVGGAIGAVLRYAISISFLTQQQAHDFPYATLVVNLLGCFVLGLLSSNLIKIRIKSKYLFAINTGLIGSFTTFSALSAEVIQLLQHDYYAYAMGYILISAIGGLGSAACGMRIGGRLGERNGVHD